jgi:hypothetical protein
VELSVACEPDELVPVVLAPELEVSPDTEEAPLLDIPLRESGCAALLPVPELAADDGSRLLCWALLEVVDGVAEDDALCACTGAAATNAAATNPSAILSRLRLRFRFDMCFLLVKFGGCRTSTGIDVPT